MSNDPEDEDGTLCPECEEMHWEYMCPMCEARKEMVEELEEELRFWENQ